MSVSNDHGNLYTTQALRRLTGATYRQVSYWTQKGYLTPVPVEGTPAKGSGNWRIYDESAVAKVGLMVAFADIETSASMADALLSGADYELPGGYVMRLRGPAE